jgi:hypothetical protein
MVRKAFVHIRRALPDMFHYLDNPVIPKSTNSLAASVLRNLGSIGTGVSAVKEGNG